MAPPASRSDLRQKVEGFTMLSPRVSRSRLLLPSLRIIALACAVASAGCSTRLGQFTGSLSDVGRSQSQPGAGEPIEALAKRYDAKPGDKRASLAYAERLRTTGQHAQAVAVLQRASIANVGDREVAAAYGKALADVGRFEEATKVLTQAHSADRPDFRVLSTQGAIADQMGDHARAREFYTQALQIAPEDPNVLTNMALSHVLTRELDKAEALLRRAASQPGAGQRTHANLALVQSLRQQATRGPAPRATQMRHGEPPQPQRSAAPRAGNTG